MQRSREDFVGVVSGNEIWECAH